jgi:hypothetical protein
MTQVTLNNLTVGRSVLEALRLLEAFQAVAKHGVLCPIDWKPNNNAADTISTILNTLMESYKHRLANLQKEFGCRSLIWTRSTRAVVARKKAAHQKPTRRRVTKQLHPKTKLPAFAALGPNPAPYLLLSKSYPSNTNAPKPSV